MDKEGLLKVSRRSPIRSQRSMTEKDKEILISKYFLQYKAQIKKQSDGLLNVSRTAFL